MIPARTRFYSKWHRALTQEQRDSQIQDELEQCLHVLRKWHWEKMVSYREKLPTQEFQIVFVELNRNHFPLHVDWGVAYFKRSDIHPDEDWLNRPELIPDDCGVEYLQVVHVDIEFREETGHDKFSVFFIHIDTILEQQVDEKAHFRPSTDYYHW